MTDEPKEPGRSGLSTAHWAWLIALIALILRAIYLVESADDPFRQHLNLDPRVYDLWARRILGGEWLGTDAFPQAPLYPYFVALIYALLSPAVARVLWVQALLAAATAGLGAHVAGRLWGRTALIATGLLLACYQPGIFYTGVLLVPVLATFLLALALALAARPLLAGLAIGLTGLAQPLLLPGALAAVLGVRWSDRTRRTGRREIALVLLGTLLVLAPVTLHNAVRGRAWVPIAANSGINLYIGNGPQATGFYAPPTGSMREGDVYGIAQASQLAGRELRAAEASRFWTARALAAMREHPGRALALAGRKLDYFLQAHEAPQVESLDFEKRYARLLQFPLLPTWIALLALAVMGIVVRRRDRAWLALLLATGITALATALFFVTARFRFPAHLWLALAAGASIAGLAPVIRAARTGEPGLRRGATRRLALGFAAALAALLLLVPGWLPGSRPRAFGEFHYRLGQLAERDRREPDARREYAEALRLAPGNYDAAIRLGVLEARAGELDQAQPLLERGVALDPGNALGLLTLAQIHQTRMELASACSLYARAWAADPTQLPTLEFYATASYLRGDAATAESLATELVRRAGVKAPLAQRCAYLLARYAERRRLGWPPIPGPECAAADLAQAEGDLARAEAGYRSAVERDATNRAALLELARLAAARGDAAGLTAWRARYLAAGGPAALLPAAR
jgi:hypothetical protein